MNININIIYIIVFLIVCGGLGVLIWLYSSMPDNKKKIKSESEYKFKKI
jgi:hypothetical protein